MIWENYILSSSSVYVFLVYIFTFECMINFTLNVKAVFVVAKYAFLLKEFFARELVPSFGLQASGLSAVVTPIYC